MEIKLPELCLVLLVGSSGSGKSTFAKKHFLPTEIVSSDYCRALVSDDENSLDATNDAFDVLQYITKKRLQRGKLTVIDATNVQKESRMSLIEIAKQYHVFTVAIVLKVNDRICRERNKKREDRDLRSYVIRNQSEQLRKSLKDMKHEKIRFIHILKGPEEIDKVSISRTPLWNNLKHEHGPFDIIGDVHGCYQELCLLLDKLGYNIEKNAEAPWGYQVTAPVSRKAVFVGDLVDRGPDSPEVLKLVMSMVKSQQALCVPGNHDAKLLRKLSGRNVSLKHGLAETMEQLEQQPQEFIEEVRNFLDGLISHFVLDEGNLVVSHAGLREDMQGRTSGAVRSFCMYGETTGEIDEFGLPVRYNWASEYKGKAMVVYGHTPVPEAEWFNNTIDIDTGCVFGGKLTALRYPEKELVSIPAAKEYSPAIRPLDHQLEKTERTAQQQHDDILDIEDYLEKFIVNTRLRNKITVRKENAAAALEVMSRFAIDPKWLIYLPPTMSPCETSARKDYLEYPQEAFQYYANNKQQQVICEKKHMGSRAVIVLCQDEKYAQARFGIIEEKIGVCYTRTGRGFFEDEEFQQKFLYKLRDALSKSNFWEQHKTKWVCLDCELMPWSVKAQALLKKQYAAVAASAKISLEKVIAALQQAQQRGVDTDDYVARYQNRQQLLQKYTDSYRNYCWPVNSLDDIKVAPFHILATEGQIHSDKSHLWHLENIHKICDSDPSLLYPTEYKVVDLQDTNSIEEATNWWLEITSQGAEGMVVKPMTFTTAIGSKLLQPAVKCRGREYLRMIYGPEYTEEENLQKLRNRILHKKQSLALREFCLGVESLERFVSRTPLRQVHQCVFAILAMESEPVDPRL